MIIYPICITKQIGSLVQIHVNSYKYGHDVLCWFKSHDKSRLFHVKLSSADVILFGFTESSQYTFFTANSENKIPSSAHTAYFDCDDPTTHLNKLKNYVSTYDDPEYVESLVSRIAEQLSSQEKDITGREDAVKAKHFGAIPAKKDLVMPIELLQQEWAKVKDPQDYEYSAYAKLYQSFERYYMLKSKSVNKDSGISFGITGLFSPMLETGYQITRVDIYAKHGEVWQKDRVIHISKDKTRIGYDFSTLYKICAYTNSDMAYEFMHYQPDESFYSYLWSTSSQNDEDVMSADISLDHTDIDMTTTEIQWYNEASRIDAGDWIAARPQFSNVLDFILYFYIPSYKLLTSFGKKFYLAAKETDLAFGTDYQVLSEITSEYVGVNYANCCLGGDVYFYIVDEALTPVSKTTRFSFDEDLESYKKKVHTLEVKNYRQRLEDVMQVRYPDVVTEISAYCGILATSYEDYTEYLWRYVLLRMNMNQGDNISRPRIFFGIMEEYLGNFTLDRNFFLDDIVFYHSTSVFTFPRIKDRNYVLVVCSLNKYSSNLEENYYPSFNTSIEIQTTEYDYTIMYAIDKDTYKRSGFIIACREDNGVVVYNNDIGVFNDNRVYVEGKG